MTEPAPRPTPGFAIAIVGHRLDRIENPERVAARIGEILERVAPAVGGAAALRLVSALAEGADRLAASAALAFGVSLDAILPFPAEEYERDFKRADSRVEFRALLGRAASVLVLDGAPGARDRAYEAAGMALLDNCDLLVAVWDGGAGRGRGGTREVIDEAARRAIPIVTIRPDGEAAALRRAAPGAAGSPRLEDLPEAPLAELAELAALIARAGSEPDAESDWLAGPAPQARGWTHFAYPLLLGLAGAGRKRRRSAVSDTPPPPPPSPLHAAFDWWDRVAISSAQAFRSAVIVNFALAALAVVLAAFSVLVEEAKWVFVLAEVATILLLLANTWYAGRQRWQERWLGAREIAELLRVSILLRQVGIGRGLAAERDREWSGRYAQALGRAMPAQSVDLSDAKAASDAVVGEIAGQAGWNEATAIRMHKVAHRIERFGEILFVAVLAMAVLWLVLWFAEPHLAKGSKHLLTALTAGLPALATASYGIRIILDFEGVAARAHHLGAELHAALAAWHAAPASAASLQRLVRRTAEVMLGDVASWRLLAEGRRLAVPG